MFQQFDNGFLHALRRVTLGKVLAEGILCECDFADVISLLLRQNGKDYSFGQLTILAELLHPLCLGQGRGNLFTFDEP